jgi:hypothetical protein
MAIPGNESGAATAYNHLVYASGAGVRRCHLKEEKLIHVGYSKKKIHEVCRATLLHQVASTKVQERRRLETLCDILSLEAGPSEGTAKI